MQFVKLHWWCEIRIIYELIQDAFQFAFHFFTHVIYKTNEKRNYQMSFNSNLKNHTESYPFTWEWFSRLNYTSLTWWYNNSWHTIVQFLHYEIPLQKISVWSYSSLIKFEVVQHFWLIILNVSQLNIVKCLLIMTSYCLLYLLTDHFHFSLCL